MRLLRFLSDQARDGRLACEIVQVGRFGRVELEHSGDGVDDLCGDGSRLVLFEAGVVPGTDPDQYCISSYYLTCENAAIRGRFGTFRAPIVAQKQKQKQKRPGRKFSGAAS